MRSYEEAVDRESLFAVVRLALPPDIRKHHKGHLLAQRLFVEATCSCAAHDALDRLDGDFDPGSFDNAVSS